MGTDTKIQWAHHTFSPWRGCTKVSAGCKHCYADTLSKRNPRVLGEWGPHGRRVVAAESAWRQVKAWNRKAQREGVRYRVFPSLCDPFEDWDGPIVTTDGDDLCYCTYCDTIQTQPVVVAQMSPNTSTAHCSTCGHLVSPATMADVRRSFFSLVDRTPNLDWLLLTKRPENIRRMWPFCDSKPCQHLDECGSFHAVCYWEREHQAGRSSRFRPNVWLVASAEDQQTLDQRMAHLLRCRHLSPVLMISAEPLLGPLQFGVGDAFFDYGVGGAAIDGVIVGGESGPRARPCRLGWIREIRRQCEAAGVCCYVKQLGSQPRDPHAGAFDPKGGDPAEWPADLRVRQLPQVEGVGA